MKGFEPGDREALATLLETAAIVASGPAWQPLGGAKSRTSPGVSSCRARLGSTDRPLSLACCEPATLARLFGHLPLSVGVANLRDFADRLQVWPALHHAGGAGCGLRRVCR